MTNPPVYDFADFLNDNTAKIVGVAISAGVCDFAPRFRCRKSRRHIRALRRDFVDQLSRHPSHSESEFESLTYHHVSQLSNRGCAGAPVVITLGSGTAELLACGVAAARPGVAFRSAFPGAGYLYIPAARCDERARRAATPACRHATGTTAYLRHARIIINPPRMSWRRLSGVYTVRCRSWNRLQRRERWLRVI